MIIKSALLHTTDPHLPHPVIDPKHSATHSGTIPAVEAEATEKEKSSDNVKHILFRENKFKIIVVSF